MAISQEGLERIEAYGLKPEQLPRHVAVIMDGNGRWAQRRRLPRVMGHRRGIQSVRAVVEEGCRLGLEQLTLYCLSVENWKRPPRELTFLMRLLRHFLVVERRELCEQNVQLRMIGRTSGLPPEVLDEFERTAELTASNDGMILCLAVNYGGRCEIADAARRLAEDVRAGRLDPEQVGEETVASYLYTSGMSDPDLLDPHGRRDANQQLPALADFVFGDVGHSHTLARLSRRRPDAGLPGVRGPGAKVRRACRRCSTRMKRFQ